MSKGYVCDFCKTAFPTVKDRYVIMMIKNPATDSFSCDDERHEYDACQKCWEHLKAGLDSAIPQALNEDTRFICEEVRRRYHGTTYPIEEIAEEFGISTKMVGAIVLDDEHSDTIAKLALSPIGEIQAPDMANLPKRMSEIVN